MSCSNALKGRLDAFAGNYDINICKTYNRHERPLNKGF